jgi:hypothetical protein
MGNGAISTARTIVLATLVTLTVAGCSHEAADWKSATLANTAEAYQSFLQQYPHGRETADAQTRIKQLTEERDWQGAMAANSRDAYQQFMAQHPDSKWMQEAQMRIENFAQADVSGGAGTSNATASAGGAATGAAGAPATAGAVSEPGASAPHNARTPSASSQPSTKSAASHLASSTRSTRAVALAHSGPSSGAQWIQLGAFGSKARAESQWKVLASRYAALKSLQPHYVAVRSKAHHMYRLQVRVTSAAAASGLCASMKRHSQVCMRVNA